MKHPTIRPIALTGLILAAVFTHAIGAAATGMEPLRRQYKSALVMDLANGAILHQDRSHEKTDPASLIKMMVVLIAMEGIARGELHLDDKYVVSAQASKIGGHQVYLKQGEVFALEELLKAVMIGSANDAAYAIAEHVAGSQERFVERMNARAKQLGMRDTRFANAHGLPPDRRKGQEANYSSAHDLALLARELMKHPLVMKWSSTRMDSFRNGSLELLNTNHRFLRQCEGANGLKTGYHPRGAGHSLVGTAVRDGRQLLAVVLGAKSARIRLQAARKLLDLGFATKP